MYCDGTSGTPDLRGRTLIGTGFYSDIFGSINYSLGTKGGDRLHQLSIAEMPSHQHTEFFAGRSALNPFGSVSNYLGIDADNGGGSSHDNLNYTAFAGGNQPHNTLPPYMVVHWIMKL